MSVELGSADCRALFALSKDYVFLNHGSFGTIPLSVHGAWKALIDEIETCPDYWFKHKYQSMMRESRRALAPLLNCNPEDLVFVENASTGVHTAMLSVGLQSDEGVLVNNVAYPAIANTSRRFSEETKGKYHVIEIGPPVSSNDEVVEKYRSYLSLHPNIKVAVIDHITSPSTIVLPVKEIVQVCREKGVVTIIDGAHAVGHLKLDLKEINPDYYTSNLHKWLYCPRGCAFLYIRPELQASAQPSLASNDHHSGYPHNFFYQGTRDYTPYCVVPEALKFQEMLGGMEKIVAYCSDLCSWGAKMLSEKWSEPLLSIPDNMRVPNMALIRVPSVLQGKDKGGIVYALYRDYKIISSIEVTAGEYWLRISCNVYNNKKDLEQLGEAVLDITRNY